MSVRGRPVIAGERVLPMWLGPALPDAACRGAAPLWDIDGPPGTREHPDERTERLRAAVEVCRTCSVMAACRRAADDEVNPSGVWGGELFGRPARQAR